MFAARVRASLNPLFHGRYYNSSSVTRNCEIAEVSKRILQERDGKQIMSSTGNGLRIKLFNRSFHSSPQCSDTSESDVVLSGVRTLAPALFSHLEDDLFSELGPVEKDLDRNVIVKMLTQKPEPLQVKKPELVQKTKSKKTKKKKKKKKHDQASDSVSKPMLLTEKPEVSWKTNGKRKTETHTSSPARDVTDSNVSFSKPTMPSSPVQDLNSKSQSIISPSSEPRNESSSKGSATSNHPSSVVFIRIGNLNSKTADSLIHSMCLSVGPLEGLARVNEDTVDVLYRVKKRNVADSILEELKDTTVDNSQWTAEILPEAEEASKDEMGLRITRCCKKLDKHLLMQRILGKDLEVLLHSVMHLENHPMARDRG
ncbi:PREDICTED: uncharacterized protein LOC104749062 isoform X2 [Camelina sativa]|uniref:Uncharacterized protein LOC104749062 isoform X2 n=1 Tax=Camelina sativa TaxID=90675 RepID=A0ABM0WC43_CAMSA|nr:PREDICTED: uncharacterized protein LOC104749062 isoform X2 [Camelina sativa]